MNLCQYLFNWVFHSMAKRPDWAMKSWLYACRSLDAWLLFNKVNNISATLMLLLPSRYNTNTDWFQTGISRNRSGASCRFASTRNKEAEMDVKGQQLHLLNLMEFLLWGKQDYRMRMKEDPVVRKKTRGCKLQEKIRHQTRKQRQESRHANGFKNGNFSRKCLGNEWKTNLENHRYEHKWKRRGKETDCASRSRL